MSKLSKGFEVLANAAITLVAIVLIVLIVRNRTILFSPQNTHQQVVGAQLSSSDGFAWDGNRDTLILVLRVGCHYCDASLPLYRRLAKLESAGLLSPKLLIAMPDGLAAEQVYLDRAELTEVPHIPNISLNKFSIEGTPTILFVDPHGKVQREWVGELTNAEADKLLSSVSTVK